MSGKMREYQSYFRPEIDAMSGYQPGEQPKLVNPMKLNTNESPYPPSPGVYQTLASFQYERLRLYPDPEASELRTELASLYGYQPENIICGNGSDDILNLAIRCFCDADRPAAFADPSYSLYPTLCGLQGAEAIRIPLNPDFSLPEDLLTKAERANLLILTCPNAPTGNLYPKAIVEEICREFQGVVLIDEAYADFASSTCVEFVHRYPNVLIARTFSKSRSLAGLRFGFAIGHVSLIAGLMKMKDSYNVSMLTQRLAMASLHDPAYFADCIAKIKLAREMLYLGLLDLGFNVVESETNFLFASPPDGDGERYFRMLRKRNVIVRYFPGPVTGRYVRISIGTTKQAAELFVITRDLYEGSGSC